MVGLSAAAGTLVHPRNDICRARTPHRDTGFRGVPSVQRRFGNASSRILRRKKSFVIGRNNAVDEHRHLDAVLRSRDLAMLSPNESVFGAAEALSATNSWMV
jgi:hypothetical protein